MFLLEAIPQPVGREFSRRVALQPERLGNWTAKQGIAERVQNQRKGGLGDMVIFVADGQLGDEIAQRFEDGIERIAVTGKDHPGCKRARAFAAEDVKRLVDDVSCIGLAGSRSLDRIGDARGHRIGDGPCERPLKAGGGAKMMEEVGVGAANLGRDRF